MNNLPKEIQELRASIETLEKEYKEIKSNYSCCDEKTKCANHEMEDRMCRMMSYCHERISYLENAFYEWTYQHTKNHLPNPATPSDMQKALDGLGLSQNYEVVKPKIVVASTKRGLILEVGE